MTLPDFLIKWNGLYCEVAGSSALNQCVDLANAYIRDVLNLPIIEWTNATDFPSKAGDKYGYILNSPTNIPLEGDVVVWNGAIGHIAVFLEGNANRFTSFDQNYPTGSPCHVQGHTYANVKGWLRKKVPVIINPPMDQKYSFHQVIQFYYRIFCNADPTDGEYANWDQKQKEGWSEIQIGQDILKNDSRAQALWHNGTKLADLTIKQLAEAIVNRS